MDKVRKGTSRGNTVAKSHHRVLLRGGRPRRTSRVFVAYAPGIGMACAAATGIGMATGDDASAQAVCTRMPADSGMRVCSGMENRNQVPEAASGERPVLADEADFSPATAGRSAFAPNGAAGSMEMSAEMSAEMPAEMPATLDGNITASAGTGILAAPMGSGVIAATTRGNVTGTAGIDVTAATPAQLSGPSPLREWIGGREWRSEFGKGVRALAEGVSVGFEPRRSTGGGGYGVENARVRFGVEGPIGESFSAGGNIALFQAKSDVFSSAGNGGVETDGVSFAAAAGRQRNEIHVDGRLQHAGFAGDPATDDAAPVTGNDGSGFSRSGEAGSRLPLRDITPVPRAQPVRTNADFHDFTDSTLAGITLGDGCVPDGRPGVFIERECRLGVSDIGLHAGADMHPSPVEEIGTGMAGGTPAGERREWYHGPGAGASFRYGDGGYVLGEVSAVPGDEVG